MKLWKVNSCIRKSKRERPLEMWRSTRLCGVEDEAGKFYIALK